MGSVPVFGTGGPTLGYSWVHNVSSGHGQMALGEDEKAF